MAKLSNPQFRRRSVASLLTPHASEVGWRVERKLKVTSDGEVAQVIYPMRSAKLSLSSFISQSTDLHDGLSTFSSRYTLEPR